MGEFTASSIAVDQDKQEENTKKKGNVDYSKIEASVSSYKESAAKVSSNFDAFKNTSTVQSDIQFHFEDWAMYDFERIPDWFIRLTGSIRGCTRRPIEHREAAEIGRGHHRHQDGVHSHHRGPTCSQGLEAFE